MTPSNFDGLFYSPETGSDGLFDENIQAMMIAHLVTRPDAFFLFAGGILDLHLNGYIEQANAFEAAAKAAYPQGAWVELEPFKARVDQAVAIGGMVVSILRRTLFEEVMEAFSPKTHQLPPGFVSVFFSGDTRGYGLIFANYVMAAGLTMMMPEGSKQAPLLIIELYMNGADQTAEVFAAEIQKYWTSYPADHIRTLGQKAREIMLSGRQGWQSEVIALLPKPE